MRVDFRHAKRAIAALVCSLAFTALLGAFLGYPIAPEALWEFKRRTAEYLTAHPELHGTDYHKTLAHLGNEPLPPAPSELVALLQWHWALLGGASVASLLAFRPRALELALVYLPASFILASAAGVKVFTAVAASATLYGLALFAVRLWRTKAPAA